MRRTAVDLGYPITRLNSRSLGGTSGRRRNDDHPAIANVGLKPDACVVAAGGFVQTAKLLGSEQSRVGVGQLVKHAIDGQPVELRVVQGIHVKAADVLQHIVEQPRRFRPRGNGSEPGAALDKPAAGEQRTDENKRDGHRARAQSRLGLSVHPTVSEESMPRASGRFCTSASTTRAWT